MPKSEVVRTDLPAEALRHLAHDTVAWLTTVTDRGAPSPTPVWFVPDAGDIVVFSEPKARKVANIRARPLVSLHFNSDADGQDVVVIAARAVVDPGVPPSGQPGYLSKYLQAITGLGMTAETYDRSSSTRLRLTPQSVWLGPT